MKIHSLLSEGLIIPELVSREREAALEEVVGYLKAASKIAKDQELFEKLIQREKLGSTAIGDGIAIPHCKLKGIEKGGPLRGPRRKAHTYRLLAYLFPRKSRPEPADFGGHRLSNSQSDFSAEKDFGGQKSRQDP
jgi:hypothetical protein